MMFWIQIGVVIEVIVMNMYIYGRNSTPRYPRIYVATIISLYSFCLIAVCYMVLKQLSFYGNGNGLFTIAGFFYLLPLHFLFEESDQRNFFTICYAWLYTLIIFTISVQVGYLFASVFDRYIVTFVTETVLFMITVKQNIRFMNEYYLPMMQSATLLVQKYVNRCTLLWFFTLIFVNLNFIFENQPIIKIIAFVIIGFNVMYSYKLINELANGTLTISKMETLINMDMLTQVGSRIGLYAYLEDSMANEHPFTIIYMDLNHFKCINDEYGHLSGDLYLKEFAHKLQHLCQNESKPFRISGDEFVVVCACDEAPGLIRKIERISFTLSKHQINFLGVSIGIAQFPKEAVCIDDIIYLADQRMYEKKRQSS